MNQDVINRPKNKFLDLIVQKKFDEVKKDIEIGRAHV